MKLTPTIIETLNDNANRAGFEGLQSNTDLFKFGVLDSFSLVEIVSLIESEYGISVPDSDVEPVNFQTIDTIESYISSREN